MQHDVLVPSSISKPWTRRHTLQVCILLVSFPSVYGMSHGKVWDFLKVARDMTITSGAFRIG